MTQHQPDISIPMHAVAQLLTDPHISTHAVSHTCCSTVTTFNQPCKQQHAITGAWDAVAWPVQQWPRQWPKHNTAPAWLAQALAEKQHGSHKRSVFVGCSHDCRSAGPRLLQLRYKLTLTTYRLANTIWNVKLLWRYCTRPLVQGHQQLSRRFHPYIQQLAGRSLTAADTQLLAQVLAVALPLAALLLLVRVLRAQRRPRRQ